MVLEIVFNGLIVRVMSWWGHNPVVISSDGKTLGNTQIRGPVFTVRILPRQQSVVEIIGPLYVLGSAQVSRDVGEVFCLAGNLGAT